MFMIGRRLFVDKMKEKRKQTHTNTCTETASESRMQSHKRIRCSFHSVTPFEKAVYKTNSYARIHRQASTRIHTELPESEKENERVDKKNKKVFIRFVLNMCVHCVS